MAGQPERDDIDDFFAAAENSDPGALRRAANNLGSSRSGENPRSDGDRRSDQPPDSLNDDDFLKFLAVEAEDEDDSEAPFKIVPVHIPSVLPRWAWFCMGVVLAGLFASLLLLPGLLLNGKTSRLTRGNYAKAQSAMRELIVTGDRRTVDKLFEMASSQDEPIASRLRAIDALTMMREPSADRVLLRLAIAEHADERIRRAAENARRQRQASLERPDAD
ncbi:MAG: HEAT repeat domain-containing protein [Planctomycetota bacterium]|jgi:hypothetical protein|nr:HEAT repeat domain-containing protein [Planctomycetota bacterium]